MDGCIIWHIRLESFEGEGRIGALLDIVLWQSISYRRARSAAITFDFHSL